MGRDGQVVQVGHERPGNVLDDLIAAPPGNAANAAHLHLPVHDRRFVPHFFVEHDLDLRRALVGLAFQVIEQVADGQIRLAVHDEIQGRVTFHRLNRDGGDVRAEGDGFCAAILGQEGAVHIVFQRRRGHLSQVVLGLVLVQHLGELGPADFRANGVDDRHRVIVAQDGGHLGQRYLGPNHVFA